MSMRAGLAMLLALAQPLAAQEVPPAYQPRDADERGLWLEMDEAERRIAASNFVMRDPALNAYVRGVLCRAVGPRCAEVRLYLVRSPYFNAAMAPNGMMHVWSGLFLRTRDEAQLAAVLAHEFTHYDRQHSLKQFRDMKAKSSAFGFLSVPLAIVTGGLGAMLGQAALMATIYGFSREQERDADAGSIALLRLGGYDPHAASRIWAQVREERAATASQRTRKPRGEDAIFGTHPTSAERMATLARLADADGGGAGELGRKRYRAALAPHWATLIDDQVKLNDFGGTELLLGELAREGWTGELLHARGELYRMRGRPEDLKAAAGFYRQALAGEGAPVEARRGLGLALLRSGDAVAGRAALVDYLAAAPMANDRALIAQMAGVTP